jgi:hypothetical protein
VSAYSEDREEAFRARALLKDWAGEGFLTDAQYRLMEQETPCELRTTNIFLRAVLFGFTVFVACAATGLFVSLFLPGGSQMTTGIVLMFFAAGLYGASEFAVSEYRFFRHGIEEALAVCSAGFLCVGMEMAFFRGSFLVPAVGVAASLWIWTRFGRRYAFLAAMIFAVWIPGYATSSPTAKHLIIALLYSIGLFAIATARAYSFAEASLWLGIYLAINLQISAVNLFLDLGNSLGGLRGAVENPKLLYPASFYWATWVLIWCLPPVILFRGVRLKDRFIMAAGAIAALLTLITNKPYLGWPRHTWDPMLLGALLIGIALFLRRCLPAGFTAQRLSGKDKAWLNAGASALGMFSPHPAPGPEQPHFGGGDSAGGGATSDF